jgi:hypothetical protein
MTMPSERDGDMRAMAEAFAVPAVRYALGRRTYITGLVARNVEAMLDQHAISAADRRVIRRDIEEHRDREALGDPCDRDIWLNLLAKLSRGADHAR